MPKGKEKDEERIEKIIRGLLKLPENKRCINCNSLGPQYICTTFWTFVCTNCSGVHREFTHRVKSVSMAKFSTEEVAALQAGGNERARQIYFKAWDPQRNYFPDGSNLHRLCDFIKHVYIDRKYAGARGNDKLSMVKAGTDDARRDDFFKQHSFENSFPSRRTDGRNLRNHIDERNSPRYKQERLKSGSQNSRAPHFEIVDDRFREDGYGAVRKFGSNRYSNSVTSARSSSPISEKSRDMTSQPAIRPLRDILGDKVPPITVGGSPKANVVDGSAHFQAAGSSRSLGSVDKKGEENKTVNTLSSLIDFDANPEPSATTAVVHPQQTVRADDGGKITTPSARNEKASNSPNANSLESLLFGLAGPVGSTSDMPSGGDTSAAIVGSSNMGTVSNNGGITTASQVGTDVAFPNSRTDSKVKVTDVQQSPAMQQSEPFAVAPENNSFTAQQDTTSPGAVYNQSVTSEFVNVEGPPTNALFGHSAQVVSKSENNESPSGRKELPVDLFTSSYSSFATALPGWQSTSPYGMGYSTQYYPTAMSLGAPQDSAKSRNPFDIGDDGPQHQAIVFPSMSSLQGALPNMSSLPGLQPRVLDYASAMHPPRPYAMMRPSGLGMGQHITCNMLPSRPQVANSFGGNDAAFVLLNPTQKSSGMKNDTAFASLNPVQQSNGVNPLSAAPHSYSLTGGNPFG